MKKDSNTQEFWSCQKNHDVQICASNQERSKPNGENVSREEMNSQTCRSDIKFSYEQEWSFDFHTQKSNLKFSGEVDGIELWGTHTCVMELPPSPQYVPFSGASLSDFQPQKKNT